jgi:aspartate dehydrogenase
MKKIKIGIIGCGAIGSSLARAIKSDFRQEAELVALYDIDRNKIKSPAAASRKELISKSDLVIEAASARVSFEVAKDVLSSGKDVMVMSVGGLLGHLDELMELARKTHAKLYIPSGAITGVDALKAASLGKARKVVLTTRKNPVSFKGVKYVEEKGIKLDKIKKDRVLFSGSAKEAVRFFPQNVNVAAVLSLAGIGEDRTRVRIIASPLTKKNIHEIEIDSEAAKITTRTENILHPDNPKTSYLAVLSAIASLKQILGPIKIGS